LYYMSNRSLHWQIYLMKCSNKEYLQLVCNMSTDSDQYEDDSDVAIETAKPKLKKPSMYTVVMFNDDYTPMEFVVEVLEMFFSLDRETATRIMLTVHTEGRAVCGSYTRDIAETKAAQVNQYSRENQHPLLCEIESLKD